MLASCSVKQAAEPPAGEFKTEYLTPVRIVKVSGNVGNAAHLLEPYVGQVSTDEPDYTSFGKGGSVLLDFGKEIQGGIEVVRTLSGDGALRFRLCLGESVSEALSNVDDPGCTATNDHSARDFVITVPWLGSAQYGNSGFRFARLDFIDEGDVDILAVRAVSKYRDIPYLGSFESSDSRLNEIWRTAAYTVHLNMQEYLWDGIKRDRLVWMGDLHPEVMTVGTVFGDQEVVRKSLDYVRDKTAPTDWMNGMISYSLWWIIIHHQWYMWYGDMDYLREQKDYMAALLRSVMSYMDGNRENYPDSGRFLDWPSNDNPAAIHAGLQAITARALDCGSYLMGELGENALSRQCKEVSDALKTYCPDPAGSGQAAAHEAIALMLSPADASAIILAGGPEKCTSFMGYYMLEALAMDGRYEEAMKLMSDYWGGMLDLGATTFWEDFNFNDARNAARIDDIVPEGKFDIHADGGAWCYVGLRHSFCHGWAGGPAPWLSRHVLGIEVLEPGFKKVRIEPHLGALEWAKGTFPTPYGVIEVSHRRDAGGKVLSDIKVPRGIKVVK